MLEERSLNQNKQPKTNITFTQTNNVFGKP